MIEWLLRSITDCPGLDCGLLPEGLLDPVETERYEALRMDKRRKEWLLGRWTAKELMVSIIKKHYGIDLPLSGVRINSEPSGAPYAYCSLSDIPERLPFRLSLSHSGGKAFCAAVSNDQANRLLGVDIERIEPRQQGFAEDYFTWDELDLLKASEENRKLEDVLVSAVWSAKEAVLKALKIGLTVDTRVVACLIEPVWPPPEIWTPFAIRLHQQFKNNRIRFKAWWRVMDSYVMTVTMATAT